MLHIRPTQDPAARTEAAPASERSDALDRLLELARETFDVQAASLRLIEGEDLQPAASAGLGLLRSERETAFCRGVIASGRPFFVTDASLDRRFGVDRLLFGEPGIRFYAGAPLSLDAGAPDGILCLFDTRPRTLSDAEKRRFGELAERIASAAGRRRDAATIRRLRAEVGLHASMIREQAAALAHSRKTFAGASAAARIGIWECRLPDERLDWSDVTYDLFEMPRGSAIRRDEILYCYSGSSLQALHDIRSRAIRERKGFSLDAEIVTAKGRQRWIRITASVECASGAAIRIYGMKQDITEEKALADRTRYLAEFDAMTGLANRSLFETTLSGLGERRRNGGGIGALLLVDLDGFKQVNDTFGHALGDECLKVAAARLQTVCRSADLVARIGGDEFAVLLGGHLDGDVVERVAGRIVDAMRWPLDRAGLTLSLGASVGVARADGCTPRELFTKADTALYAAKAAGRNAFRTFVPGMILGVAAPANSNATDGGPYLASR